MQETKIKRLWLICIPSRPLTAPTAPDWQFSTVINKFMRTTRRATWEVIKIFIMEYFGRLIRDGTLNCCYVWLIEIDDLSLKVETSKKYFWNCTISGSDTHLALSLDVSLSPGDIGIDNKNHFRWFFLFDISPTLQAGDFFPSPQWRNF